MGCCSSSNRNIKSPQAKDRGTPHPPQPYSQHDRSQSSQLPPQILEPGQTPNDKIRIDTPSGTEENKAEKKEEKQEQSLRINSARGREQSNKKAQQYDLCPKQSRSHKIYHLSANFPVQKPYSTHSDWQKTLQKSIQGNPEELVPKILGLRNRHWIQEQIKLQIEVTNQNVGSFDSLVTQRHFIQLREHFNWLTWAVAHFYFLQKHENKYRLPKANSKHWFDGFEYKGVYIRVLPYEEAYFVQNELQALKYVQQEILELNSLSPALTQQYKQLGKENLAKDVILPLLSAVSCGGFYLFGSPVIYMQELEQQKEFLRENLNASRVLGVNNSVVQQANYNSAQLWHNQSQVSFSYLHNNINNELVQNSLFKFMPVLKSVSSRNMIPIVDFEEFNQNLDEQNLELKYILVNLFDVLPKLGEYNTSTALVKFPCHVNEELQLLQLPIERTMDLKEVRTLMNIEDEESKGEDSFIKRPFQKHGWEFLLVQNGAGSVNENFRATNFFNQKEIQIRQKGSPLLDNYNSNAPNQSHLHDELGSRAEERELEEASRQYISPQKQTILRRQDSVSDVKIFGNALVSGYYYKRDFKIKYSLNGHSYSTSLENMFSVGAEQVARVIEQSDNIYNRESLKELMHRKGLNLRFEWIVLVKLRLVQAREIVMVDILVRTMRKIINEEIKIKSKVSQQQMMENGQALVEEYYQGNQLDLYKDILIFYMNAILMRKFAKLKQVFDETLTGLFLSRLAILGLAFQMNLSKEELIYLESRDVLEDILETPSKNPVLFVNAVQTYFSVEFSLDFLRVCRQDKLLLLSRSQPVTSNDIKQLGLHPHFYYTIKEQAYFMLARSITHHSKERSPIKGNAKVMTQSDKDILKQSFQKPKQDDSLISQPSHRNQQRNDGLRSTPSMGLGPQGLGRGLGQNDSLMVHDHQDSKTDRNNKNNHLQKDQLTTIRQYQNIDRELIGSDKQIEEFTSPPLNASKLVKLSQQTNNNIGKKNQSPYDLSKLSKRTNFQPKQVQEIIMPSIMYKMKTYITGDPHYFFDEQSNTYIGDTLTVLKSHYEMPSLDIVNEWVIVMESFLKDVYSVGGSEQVLLEAFVYQAILTHFFEQDPENLFKILSKIRDQLFVSFQCSPECIIVIQILTGIFFEDQKEAAAIESEKSYLTGMICILQLYGDPRGRGNLAIPYTLFFAWKLSLLALADDKKLHDSEFAEELFDACLKSLHNHRKLYKEQQLQNHQNGNKEKGMQGQFDIETENNELKRELFDIKKYKIRPSVITVASGFAKQGSLVSARESNLIKKPNQPKPAEERKAGNLLQLPQKDAMAASLKSRSQIPALQRKYNHEEKNEMMEVSDIDLEIEDETKHKFMDTNFKNNEWYIGQIPFKHWSLSRQTIYQKIPNFNSAAVKKNPGELVAQKQAFREFIRGLLGKEVFFQWMLKFNPLMYQSGVIWSNKQIKDVVFNQNQQMVSSSSSSVVLSNHNFSHQSSLSSNPTSAKEKRNMHLGTYSQIFGKESGGISKSDMNGVLFTWGSDNSGQLGVNIVSPNDQQSANLKVLYPRMVLQLRDEIIKEICCGHSHTLVINIHGIVFGWGLNEQGQLGLGPKAPPVIKKPVLNPFLSNIVKLSAGNEHSIGLTKNGELYAWGGGGLTGTGDQTNITVPTRLKLPKIQNAVCGGLHTVAVTKDGEIMSWGSTEGGQLGLSQQSIMTLTQGQGIPVLTPQKIPKLIGQFIVQVACGEAHTIVMSKDNKIFGWGMSNYGQLGLGFSSDSFEPGIGMERSKVHEPQEITHLKNETIKKIICGATFSLFHTDKGELFGCGMNDLGQLGLDTFMDDIRSLEGAKQGRHHTTDVTVPTRVICLNGIPLQSIACGENHALAISGDNGDNKNMVWAWGMYRNGQLGLGEVQMKMNPRPVQNLSQSHINKVACGSLHSMALLGDSSSVSTFSPQYYANNDELKNPWQCDMRGLSFMREGLGFTEEEVPNDGEGKTRIPK